MKKRDWSKPRKTAAKTDATYMAKVLDWALRYAAMGVEVFPAHSVHADGSCTCRNPNCKAIGKHPRTKRGMKDASRDKVQIERWFGPKAPLSNVAGRTGKESNITIIDVDSGPGKVGAATWATLIREHGEPDTLKSTTGSGGSHMVFQYTPALKTGTDRLGKHVDVKNDGGCVILPPSRHKSGSLYTWANWGMPLAPLPEYLISTKPADAPTRGRPRKDDPQRRKYGYSEVREMLAVIPADDRDLWLKFGIVLGRTFDCSDEAWQLYKEWAEKWDGTRDQNHDKNMRDFFYIKSQESADRELSIGTIVKLAMEHGWAPKSGGVPVEDFVYLGPSDAFIYRHTLDTWSGGAVNVAVSPVNVDGQVQKASEWLKKHRCMTSLANDPSIEGEFAYGKNCVNGELVPSEGACVLNIYPRPTLELGDPTKAWPYVEHVHCLMPKDGDADQFLDYISHRAQRPGEKSRFALVIGGEQGVGKDTAIDMCGPTLGTPNVVNIAPSALSSQFNEPLASVLVRISETSNQKEMSRYAFYEMVKVPIAGAPDYCVINPKYGHKYTVRLHCGVIITTNHLLSGIYIPQDDRRYDVIECATRSEMGLADDAKRRAYFERLWKWFYQEDGARHIAAFLHARDLTRFSPNNGQRKTAAHQQIIQNSMSGDEWFHDALEAMGNPDLFRGDVFTLQAVRNGEDLSDVRGKLPHAAERASFKRYLSPTRDGRWPIGENRKCALFLRQGVALPTKAEREKLLKADPNELLKKY